MEQSTTIYYADGVTPMAPHRRQEPHGHPDRRDPAATCSTPSSRPRTTPSTPTTASTTRASPGRRGTTSPAATGRVPRRSASSTRGTWADLEGVTYARKLREAVIAMKLNQEYTKDQILDDVPQHRLLRTRGVRHPGGGHGVLQQAREGPDAWPRAWSSPASSRTPRARRQGQPVRPDGRQEPGARTGSTTSSGQMSS